MEEREWQKRPGESRLPGVCRASASARLAIVHGADELVEKSEFVGSFWGMIAG
jgi:hypothetical protein